MIAIFSTVSDCLMATLVQAVTLHEKASVALRVFP